MEAATAWKDISKETGLIMTVTTKSFFLSHTLPKALFLQWQEVRAISSHISEDWKAACPHGNCSLLRALPSTRGAACPICCLPMASPVLDVFRGLSPDPWAWTERKSVRYCLPVFSNYHFLPWLFFCIVGQPQWLVLLNNFRNKCRIWKLR